VAFDLPIPLRYAKTEGDLRGRKKKHYRYLSVRVNSSLKGITYLRKLHM
jgi:hypothetical protein